jgi:tRNA (guanosine-2'-O-)-methyltransferase
MNYRKLYNFLAYYLNDNRRKLLEEKIEEKTTHLTIIVEDIYQSQNINALIRTCECLGIHHIHVIETYNDFEVNAEISMGAAKWLKIFKYSSIEECVQQLKTQGYDIVATTPSENSKFLEQVEIDNKIALMFGTELNGLTEKALSLADYSIKIPMFGFTESYNISVSVAICLYELTQKLRNSSVNYKMNETEKFETLAKWAEESIKKPELLIQEFLNKKMKEENTKDFDV